ncbi:MAG: hypothetical protein M1830_004183 [Pleopsidium flavum]|nr:MAG: hypothetical protein M1830_004183 [Pleopsidium flavum]
MSSWTMINQTGTGWTELNERPRLARTINPDQGPTTEHITHARNLSTTGTSEAAPLYHHIQYFTPGGSPGPSCTHIEYAGQYPESAPSTPGSLAPHSGGPVTRVSSSQSDSVHVRFLGPFPRHHDYSGLSNPDHYTAPFIEEITLEGPPEYSPPTRPPLRSRPSTPYPHAHHHPTNANPPNHFDNAFARALGPSPNAPSTITTSPSSTPNSQTTAPLAPHRDERLALPSQRARLATRRFELSIPAAARFRRTEVVDREEVWDESCFWGDGGDEAVVRYAGVAVAAAAASAASAASAAATVVGGAVVSGGVGDGGGDGSTSSTSDDGGAEDADADADAGIVDDDHDHDADVDVDDDDNDNEEDYITLPTPLR